MSPVALDANAVRNWMRASQNSLGHRRAEIDALNVYPVPDGDTGTNMYLTVEAAAVAAFEVSDPRPEPGPVLEAMARGALLGARGNSGVILSQLLRGMTEVLSTTAEPGAATLAQALTRASQLAYAAVSRPVEGTVLTVSRRAAEAAGRATQDLATVARAAAHAAHEALALTPTQLPQLAAAGVVDAGGMGLVVVLDALLETLTGEVTADDTPWEVVVAHEPDMGEEYTGPRY